MEQAVGCGIVYALTPSVTSLVGEGGAGNDYAPLAERLT